jgi:hypothetical protein
MLLGRTPALNLHLNPNHLPHLTLAIHLYRGLGAVKQIRIKIKITIRKMIKSRIQIKSRISGFRGAQKEAPLRGRRGVGEA